jgi:hypothetical protein
VQRFSVDNAIRTVTLMLSLLLLPALASACIGEFAGRVHFNVSAGENQTLPLIVFNNCDNITISFDSAWSLQPMPNQTSPTIVVSPRHGTILPRVNEPINITVYMPYNAVVGTTWSGAVAAIEASNETASGGVMLNSGVSKIITITSLPPLQKGLPLYVYAIVLLVALGGSGFYFLRIRKGAKKGAATKRAAAKKAAKKGTAKKTAAKKKGKAKKGAAKAKVKRSRSRSRRR